MTFTTRVLVFAAIVAACFAAQPYKVNTIESRSYGVGGDLTYLGPKGADDTVFESVRFDAIFVNKDILRLRFTPENLRPGQKQPYSVPDDVIPDNNKPSSEYKIEEQPNYVVSAKENVIFVNNKNSQRLLSIQNLEYKEQNVSFTTNVATTAYLSGYGEHNYKYFIPRDTPNTLSLWNTDNGGIPWKKPLYGVHPVLFVADPTEPLFYGFVWINSNAQRLTLNGDALTFEAAGGLLNLYVITGTTMFEVIQNYHSILGKSAVPPYWSLGTHQCRWGYRNISDLKAVVDGYKQALLPLETLWNDIDYMEDFKIFTTDPVRYPQEELRAFVDNLHASGRHYIQIIDPGVAAANNYSTYSTGVDQDAFVKLPNGEVLINVVWPGWTAFPDFTSTTSTYNWWQKQLNAYLDNIPLDGVWLDMNELGTFCGGSCPVKPGTPWTQDWKTVDWDHFDQDVCLNQGNCSIIDSKLNNPPYNPLTNGWFIYNRTLDMEANLAMGKYYDVKTFYGMMECALTHKALLNRTQKRPFLLSRATYMGSGRYTAHWTGDNYPSWKLGEGGIKDSIQGVLAANLWGVPMVGADIGGFGGVSTEQLVTRWTQLGAFYSFMRNHHGLDGPGQEPYKFSETSIDTMRRAMTARYKLLPYLFTGLLKAHYAGGPFLRHLSVQFPHDAATYKESFQFMFGDSILVTPVVDENAETVTGYVPRGIWYYLMNQMYSPMQVVGSQTITFTSNQIGDLPTLIQGGSAIPLHTNAKMTIAKTRATGISILCAMSETNVATGELWLDDGEDGELPADDTGLTKMSYACVGDRTSGSITVRQVGSTATTGALATPLESEATVEVYFPQNVPNTTYFYSYVNGVRTQSENFGPNSVKFYLPKNIDGTIPFTAEWSATPIAPHKTSAPHTFSPSGSAPSPGGSKGTTSTERGLVIVVVILAVGLVAMGGVVFYFRKRATEETALLGNMS